MFTFLYGVFFFFLQVIVFDGTPSVTTKACTPESLLTGMNKFLQQLEVTFRRDPDNYRCLGSCYPLNGHRTGALLLIKMERLITKLGLNEWNYLHFQALIRGIIGLSKQGTSCNVAASIECHLTYSWVGVKIT